MSTRPTKPCPCGCGKPLRRHKGWHELVCYDTWRTVPQRVRDGVVMPWASAAVRRASVRQVLEIAQSVAKRRGS